MIQILFPSKFGRIDFLLRWKLPGIPILIPRGEIPRDEDPLRLFRRLTNQHHRVALRRFGFSVGLLGRENGRDDLMGEVGHEGVWIVVLGCACKYYAN